MIELEGSHKEIGLKHGKLIADRIDKTIDFYRKIFRKDKKAIFEGVEPFIESIRRYDRNIASEIEGIADGSEQDVEWIYALNSRTELLAHFTNECTAAFFPKSSILGQNWDWAKELEHLAVIMKINETKNDNQILMMTEPGIIGKIGFNSNGIGVTLNLLKSNKEQYGVPIHVILRIILQSESIRDVLNRLEPVKLGKSSNVIIGTDQGKFLDIEFCGDRIFVFDDRSRNWVHTNHYLGERINTDPEEFASSFARFERSFKLAQELEGKSIEDMKSILLDQENNLLPICRKYVPDDYIDNVGTVTSIIMDLPKREMYITKGSPLSEPFTKIPLQ